MPADPVVQEDQLLQLLHDTEAPKSPDQVRWMCNMVLLAAHGRKVKIPFFVDVINSCSTVQSLLGEIQSAGRMYGLMLKLDPERETPKLDAESEKLVNKLMEERKKLVGFMEQIIQCPTEDDTIN